MSDSCSRREFLQQVAGAAGVATGLTGSAAGPARELPKVPDHTLTVISGKPRERGKQYGTKFKDAMAAFLDREIYKKFTGDHASRDDLLRYAGQCAKAIKDYSPLIHDELEGMAEGSGLKLDEVVLLTLHEEAGKQGLLPKVQHCTALAAGPPDTSDGNTYVGQNWDWMLSAYGLSAMLHWKRPEGPSLLAYSYPGLWVGAGLNSAGVALCWTWGDKRGIAGPRVGIPAYVLIAQMLYQDTLKGAVDEARRSTHAGWFTFVLADGKGNLANVEGTPQKLAIELGRGCLARADFGSREITGTPDGRPVKYHAKCQRMWDLLGGAKGKLDRGALQGFFADHKGDGTNRICVHDEKFDPLSLDSMLFNCTTREAHIQRGPGCSNRWKTFRFE
jgi:isopenicillin-N N-acyltransferase-like protein